ncbi:MAG: beta-galactosidase/beta-glucuronidase [Cyclobacteriaceae bacterium]|jgi:beta-galactosidase/beta-glucuronidase
MNSKVMKYIFLLILTACVSERVIEQDRVEVVLSDDGHHLLVNGETLMINGMNWDYVPIGENYEYSLWEQSDAVIQEALEGEMTLLRDMGVNTIRQYTGVPAKWITYIYENYGIYTMLNHSFGRYGLTVNGGWMANTEYGDPAVKELLLAEVSQLVNEYKDVKGVLLFLLGNENNYGLFWGGAETEDIPEVDSTYLIRARAMYQLFNEAAITMKAIDDNHPIALCNGDLMFMDMVVEECQDVDIFGTNIYRGVSFGDTFEQIKDTFSKPVLFTEFGADAFDAVRKVEDQTSQAYYMVSNWKELYQNAAGKGKAENSIGGFTFQFSDGWWKYEQTENLEIHDETASWVGGGYAFDFVKGENNMNEEWFGICAKGLTNSKGIYTLEPRAAYYALQAAHQINPYNADLTSDDLENLFKDILENRQLLPR